MKANKLTLIALITLCTALTGCGTWWLPRPHKIDIQQGNLLTKETVAQIKVGMSKTQVASLLGRPLTTNQINPDLWEYIYSTNRSGEKPEVKRLSVSFQNDQVSKLDEDGFSE